MKKFIEDIGEHPVTKVIGILALIIGALLDSFNKTEYFLWVAIIIGFVLFGVFLSTIKKQKLYRTEILPIPIVINIDSTESSEYVLKNLFTEIESNTQFKDLKTNLQRYKNIVEDDLVFTYNGSIYDKERMISFIQIISYQIKKIKESTENKVEFHLAYYKRPAFGVYLGYIFAEEDLVIYQNNEKKDKFDKVAELKGRSYKNEVREYQKFDKKYLKHDDADDNLLVGIKASSHKIKFNAPHLKNFKNVISLEAKHGGTIELEEDWVQYAREIFTVLNEEQTKYKQITIAHNMPESIGIILGMAVGNYWPLMITQYDVGDYIDIIRTDKIKCYF